MTTELQAFGVASKNVTIHRLTVADSARLRTIRLRALRDAPHAFAATYEESSARPVESCAQQLRDLATYVAVEGGEDVGMVLAGPHGSLQGAAYLISMWVAPEARGRGVGIALIDALAAWAKAEGYARVALDVGAHNAHAIALYARAGFAATGEPVPAEREGTSELQMARDL